MPKPTVQQQQYYTGNNELLIHRIYDLVNDQIAQKRWEFQNTDVDPIRLWSIANQVETLNWVSKKWNTQTKQTCA
jgi:starvation-inducible outer membrane lipoprotein